MQTIKKYGLKRLKKLSFVILSSIIISCQENQSGVEVNRTEIDSNNIVTYKVVSVADGDTFDYLNSLGIRNTVPILDIDTYETFRGDRINRQAQKGGISVDSALILGLKAKDFAFSTLLNKNVELYRFGFDNKIDIYGRELYRVKIDGKKYDSLIISKGLSSKLYD
jgi:endonuclease YncB( thermonuclease family)